MLFAQMPLCANVTIPSKLLIFYNSFHIKKIFSILWPSRWCLTTTSSLTPTPSSRPCKGRTSQVFRIFHKPRMDLKIAWPGNPYWVTSAIDLLALTSSDQFPYSEKYVWLLNSFIYSFQSWCQVLQTSTDPSLQFSAPFKSGNSRQVQTCYKPQNTTQRKLQHFLIYTGTGEMGVPMTFKHWAST